MVMDLSLGLFLEECLGLGESYCSVVLFPGKKSVV